MDRSYVNNAAATALFDHLLGRDLRAEKSALEIYGHHLFVLIFGGVEDRSARFNPGVVHHDVQSSEPAYCRVDEHLQVGEIADVGFHTNRLITELADLLLECLGRLGMSNIVDYDFGLQPREFQRDRLTDPAVAAGDDSNPIP